MQRYRFINKLTAGDYILAMLIQLCRPALQILYVIIAFFLAWLMCGVLADDFTLTSNVFITTLCLYLIMMLAFIVIMSFQYKKNNDTVFKSLGYLYSEISDEYYVETYAQSASEIRWENFMKISETAGCFYLYTEKGKFVILPKRLLPAGCAELLKNKAKNIKPGQAGAVPSAAEAEIPAGEDGIESRLTAGNIISFQLYHAYVFRKNLIVCSAIILLCTVFMELMSLITGDFIYPLLFLVLLILINLLPVIGALVASRNEKMQPRRIVYRFREESFEMIHKFGNALLEWGKMYAARQTSSHYFIYITKIQAAIIPKRDMTPEAIALIDAAIRKYDLKIKKNRA